MDLLELSREFLAFMDSLQLAQRRDHVAERNYMHHIAFTDGEGRVEQYAWERETKENVGEEGIIVCINQIVVVGRIMGNAAAEH